MLAGDDGGDGIEFIGNSHARLTRGGACRRDHAGQTRQKACDGIDLDRMLADIDAGDARRLRVGADWPVWRVQAASANSAPVLAPVI
jgi:hypothetical protein